MASSQRTRSRVDRLTRRASDLVLEAAALRTSLPPRWRPLARRKARRRYDELMAEAQSVADWAKRL